MIGTFAVIILMTSSETSVFANTNAYRNKKMSIWSGEAVVAVNVTKTIQEKQNIQILAESFATLCGVELTSKMEIGQKQKYDFSKESVRRYAMKYSKKEWSSQISTGISVEKLSKRIFGKNTSQISFIKNDGWSDGWPIIKVRKIYQQPSGKYKVKANINWNSNEFKPYKIGRLNIILKKKPKSYYGYIVQSMVIKKTDE